MPTVLITGANRGLGLEFARQYADAGWRVLACCRAPEAATALNGLAGDGLTVHRLDVADHAQVADRAREFADVPIDLLLNNAGVYGDRLGEQRCVFGQTDYAAWARTFEVNTMAPMKVTECFIEQVCASERKQVVILTSRMGSIGDNTSGGSYLYRSSKSAVNMVARSLSIDLRGRGVTVVVVHPGWVATDMGGGGAPMSIPDSITQMRAVFDGLTLEQTGSFFLHDGTLLPW